LAFGQIKRKCPPIFILPFYKCSTGAKNLPVLFLLVGESFFSRLGIGTADQVFWAEIPEEKPVKTILGMHEKGENHRKILFLT